MSKQKYAKLIINGGPIDVSGGELIKILKWLKDNPFTIVFEVKLKGKLDVME